MGKLGSKDEITAIIIILCVISVTRKWPCIVRFQPYSCEINVNNIYPCACNNRFYKCLVIIRFTVSAIYLEYFLTYDIVCRVYQFLITCNMPLSALIMVAIAVDRYVCICHPFVHIMTVPRAKYILYILAGFAIVLGLITALGNAVYDEKLREVNTMEHVLVNETVQIYTGNCYLSTTILPHDFITTYQKVYPSFYLTSFLIVMVLYGLLFSSVAKERAKRRIAKQKMGAGMKVVNTQCQTYETTIS